MSAMADAVTKATAMYDGEIAIETLEELEEAVVVVEVMV